MYFKRKLMYFQLFLFARVNFALNCPHIYIIDYLHYQQFDLLSQMKYLHLCLMFLTNFKLLSILKASFMLTFIISSIFTKGPTLKYQLFKMKLVDNLIQYHLHLLQIHLFNSLNHHRHLPNIVQTNSYLHGLMFRTAIALQTFSYLCNFGPLNHQVYLRYYPTQSHVSMEYFALVVQYSFLSQVGSMDSY